MINTFFNDVIELIQSEIKNQDKILFIHPTLLASKSFTEEAKKRGKASNYISIDIDSYAILTSNLRLMDNFELKYQLFSIYLNHEPETQYQDIESWLDILIQDYNSIDYYAVDTTKLFKDVSEFKEIEDVNQYQTDEELMFWSSVYLNKTIGKTFLHHWEIFEKIYNDIN